MLSHFKLGWGPAGTGPVEESALYHRKLRTKWTCEADTTIVATLVDGVASRKQNASGD